MNATVTPLRPRRRCPECGRASERESFPFCSPRCKTVDLSRWLKGAYVLPGPAVDAAPGDADDEG